MRKVRLVFALIIGIFITASSQNSQNDFVEVASTIKEVTVFQRGAQVNRTGKSSVPAGRSVLKLSKLSPSLDPASLQFRATGDFTIIAVNHQLDYFQEIKVDEDIAELNAQKEALLAELALEKVALEVAQEEENLLLANKNLGSQQSGVNPNDLQDMANFFQARLKTVKLAKLDANKKMKTLNEKIAQINNQLNQINSKNTRKATSNVLVTIDAKVSTRGTFEVDYLVWDAGWTPGYDIRVKDINNPVTLDYKANVYQRSSEDWDQVQLTLSTGNPAESGTRPNLQPWWLGYYAPAYPPRAQNKMLDRLSRDEVIETEEQDYEAAQDITVTRQDNTTSMEFQIAEPYDIPANGQTYQVQIQKYNIPASYEYYVAPKLDKNAFLTANLTDWEQYDLLNGQANLFFEGTYLGKSTLNVQNVRDTLTLSLGRDKNIIVSRKKQKDYTDKQFIGNKKTETVGWEILLRNKKRQAINITVEDQHPISTNDEIEVKLENRGGAKVDETTGTLTWKLKLAPNENKDLNFRYSVKYPKKQALVLE